jgi:DNA-binding MarR family transcriptional regulator
MCNLSDALGVSPRNVTTLVDGLEQEGFVRRTPHLEDRRATIVELTPTGYDFAHQMLGPFHEQIAGLFRTLSLADQRELLRLLGTLLNTLQSGTDCGAGRTELQSTAKPAVNMRDERC